MSRRFALSLFLFVSGPALAHTSSTAYFDFHPAGDQQGAYDLSAAWDLRDLHTVTGLDPDGDGRITWAEVKSQEARIRQFSRSAFRIFRGGEACSISSVGPLMIDQKLSGPFVFDRQLVVCAKAQGPVTISYEGMLERDATHVGMLAVRSGADSELRTLLFNKEVRSQTFDPDSQESDRLAAFLLFLKEGVWHIWIGLDHVLFLLVLLLPGVLLRKRGRWVAHEGFSAALWGILKVVTAFTIAHSITLTLASLEWVVLPSRLVESVIAISIIVAALGNLFPVRGWRPWAVAGAFGLIHGFGFASVLADLGLAGKDLGLRLFAFNVGVEIGQVAIVAGVLPVLWFLRDTRLYRGPLLASGSLLACCLAAMWAVERMLALEFMPF